MRKHVRNKSQPLKHKIHLTIQKKEKRIQIKINMNKVKTRRDPLAASNIDGRDAGSGFLWAGFPAGKNISGEKSWFM